MPISQLTKLSALVNEKLPAEAALRQALALLRDALGADDAVLVYGEGSRFGSLGTSEQVTLTDSALRTIHRDLSSRGIACTFDLDGSQVINFHDATAPQRCTYVGARVPMAETAGEMLLARGAWPRGLSPTRVRLLDSALPALGLLTERRLDRLRAERARQQLSALASITQVFSDSEDTEAVLTAIATTTATVSGLDFVSIDLVDSDGGVALRCMNVSRPGMDELRERWKRGAAWPDPVRDALFRTRKPMFFGDTPNDERIPAPGRNLASQALIRSAAIFPLVMKDEVLGMLCVASSVPREFGPAEIELLEGLASQVAAAVKGIQLYRELAESRAELQRLNDQLQQGMGIEHHLARTDALTGIPNRRFIDETVETEVARARRYDQTLSVVVADVDQLKEINDSYSHRAGDETLRFLADVARESCREVDVVGRYGGDEFVFVLPSTKLDEAATLAERFRQVIEERPSANRTGHPLPLSVSLGVAEWDGGTMEGPAALLAAADRAMYQAKAAGRNRTMLAQPAESAA